jgi:hypothetical protein
MKVDHLYTFNGREIKLRWGNPSDPDWIPKTHYGMSYLHDNLIVLNPSIRGKDELTARALIHEAMHFIDDEMTKMSGLARQKMFDSTHTKSWHMTHPMIFRVAATTAKFLVDNQMDFSNHRKP